MASSFGNIWADIGEKSKLYCIGFANVCFYCGKTGMRNWVTYRANLFITLNIFRTSTYMHIKNINSRSKCLCFLFLRRQTSFLFLRYRDNLIALSSQSRLSRLLSFPVSLSQFVTKVEKKSSFHLNNSSYSVSFIFLSLSCGIQEKIPGRCLSNYFSTDFFSLCAASCSTKNVMFETDRQGTNKE